ncbi:MAG: hypothetical protein JNK04_22415 [Myxococcales bacterium]|nr:hypothetical protein [Myxococcales bacterium]
MAVHGRVHPCRTMTARLLLISLCLFGCESETDPPMCRLAAHMSTMQIHVTGYRAAYGDVEHARLDFCLDGTACGTASIVVTDNVECRADASLDAPAQQCAFEPDGTLLVMTELKGRPVDLHGEHALTLALGGSGLSDVSGTADIVLRPMEGNGDGCGVTHVFGSVTVDASLHELPAG